MCSSCFINKRFDVKYTIIKFHLCNKFACLFVCLFFQEMNSSECGVKSDGHALDKGNRFFVFVFFVSVIQKSLKSVFKWLLGGDSSLAPVVTVPIRLIKSVQWAAILATFPGGYFQSDIKWRLKSDKGVINNTLLSPVTRNNLVSSLCASVSDA